MSERWAIEMLELLKNEEKCQIRMGLVVGLNPLAIMVNDVTISKNILIDPMLLIDKKRIDCELNLALNYIPATTVNCIKNILSKQALNVGDRVIMIQDGNAFYVLQRLVVADEYISLY